MSLRAILTRSNVRRAGSARGVRAIRVLAYPSRSTEGSALAFRRVVLGSKSRARAASPVRRGWMVHEEQCIEGPLWRRMRAWHVASDCDATTDVAPIHVHTYDAGNRNCGNVNLWA